MTAPEAEDLGDTPRLAAGRPRRYTTRAISYGSTRLASEVVDARTAVARVAPGSMSLRELDSKLTEHGLVPTEAGREP
ncbi:hypothetical protein ACFYO1_03020 [Nocardia sp. NPDC006044]|uniref:hypothetical protein n=1 Tax=Nocardia sp. NPDC006044 TaxID=3364306 RepID=UPI0036969802